jgi:phosphoribosyl 1,2-cyclic phosphodiesterase
VEIRVWGCRGSIASPGPESVRYGGNTACVEVRLADGAVIILDAGTGIRALGLELLREGLSRIDLLLSHLHVDHLEGLGFFPPLWSPQTEMHIWGPSSPIRSLAERVETYFSPPLFPVHLSEMVARVEYHDAPEGEWALGSARIHSQSILHPGPTMGYRIEADGRTLAYLTDHEPALASDVREAPPRWISGFSVADGADLLVHDCQYTDEEYPERAGWGHSSLTQVAVIAERAGVDRLLLFHHDPMRTDEQLDELGEDMCRLWGVDGERCVVAREGMLIAV